MEPLTLILLSHNRPHFAVQAIKSILNQTESAFRLIVSDNSTTLELSEIMKVDFPAVEYISWHPGISAPEHFAEVRKLVNTPYFVMFHDDDLLEPNYVEKILEQFRNTPLAAAVGTNGYQIDHSGERVDTRLMFESRNRIECFTDRGKFITRYLTDGAGGAAPFSSYAYNTNLVRGIFMDWSRGQNYFDTIFLSDIADSQLIVWINEPLVRVRYHDDRISTRSGVRDYKAFINLVRRKYASGVSHRHIDEYRFVHLFFELKKRGRYPIAALKYFVLNFPELMVMSSNFRKRVFKYLLRARPRV